jgi:hypothetical protein
MTRTAQPMSVTATRDAWVEHRFFKYRGCAPDPTDLRRLAADPTLPVDTHHPVDRDGAEPQPERIAREDAAIELCLNCPVMVLCDRYANTITTDGKLAEPDGVWGGRRALERHRAFIGQRHQVAAAAPDTRFRTPQKQAVLQALAAFTDPYDVAAWAGMDLRTANWQRSVLVTLLNLNKATATRRELLAEAVRRDLLDAATVVDDDGTVPAVPAPVSAHTPAPGPDTVARRPELPATAGAVVAVGPRLTLPAPRPGRAAPPASRTQHLLHETGPARRARRGRFTAVTGQLTLDDALPSRLGPVTTLARKRVARLEAAAA